MTTDKLQGQDQNVLTLTKVEKVPIMVDSDAWKLLQMFLIVDLAGTGIGYSDFIRKSVEMWRGMIHDLPTLADTSHD